MNRTGRADVLCRGILASVSNQRRANAAATAFAVFIAGMLPTDGPRAAPDESVSEVVVTGSRLSSADVPSASPIVVVDSEELLHQGTLRAEDLLNSLPQVNSGLTPGANGPSVAPLTGTATADLRGIGAFRTLVLINGRRTAPGDPINPSADLNTIPTALVKRVEVLTGGASAIYGSDAVAGVVNFILDNDFTGFKFAVEGAGNRGTNDRTDLQDTARASGITPSTSTVFDGKSVDLSIAFGQAFLDGRAHLTGYAGYRRSQAVAGSARDSSACTLTETGPAYACLLDGSTAVGQFVPNGGTPLTLDTANGHAFRPLAVPGDLFNPAPYQYLQRPDTRYNAAVSASYEVSDSARFYAEAQYTHTLTTVRYEPSGTTATNAALNVYGIPCSNPLLSASQVNDLCTSYGLGPADLSQVAIGRRNVEGGQLQDEFRHQSYRLVVGAKGQISEPWSYDVSVVYGRVNGHESLSNDISQSRLANALDVVGVAGVPTCQSVVDGSDPSCVPYNIYSSGGVTPAALHYVTAGGTQVGFADRAIWSGQLVGDLGKYGWKSPLAHSAMSVAAGFEYRRESVRYDPDVAYTTGDLLVAGAAHPTAGTFHVAEVFGELKIPLAEDRPLASDVTLNLSDRYAHYTPQGSVNAYGAGGAALVAVTAMLSTAGSISAIVLAAPRILAALGRNGDMPKVFARSEGATGAPVVASVVIALLILALAITGTFPLALAITAGSMMVMIIGVCASLPRLRMLSPSADAVRIPFGRSLAAGGIGLSIVLLAQLHAREAVLIAVTASFAALNWMLVRRTGP